MWVVLAIFLSFLFCFYTESFFLFVLNLRLLKWYHISPAFLVFFNTIPPVRNNPPTPVTSGPQHASSIYFLSFILYEAPKPASGSC